jgi:hypothetical protein
VHAGLAGSHPGYISLSEPLPLVGQLGVYLTDSTCVTSHTALTGRGLLHPLPPASSHSNDVTPDGLVQLEGVSISSNTQGREVTGQPADNEAGQLADGLQARSVGEAAGGYKSAKASSPGKQQRRQQQQHPSLGASDGELIPAREQQVGMAHGTDLLQIS